ncbi:SMI1/KNR4 family protein [Promicromonospora soli]
MVSAAEESLGYTLPKSMVELLSDCNGGIPSRACFSMTSPTSWATDHIQIKAILGIGGKRGFYGEGSLFASDYMIGEWGYPDIGIMICMTPSGGHDTVMLDYSAVGPQGEPSVAYIDEDRVPQQIASSFAEFVAGLRDCSEFDD